MKSLKQYIAEAFKISKNTKLESRYKYFPETIKELLKNIKEHFEQNIYDLNDIDVSKITDMKHLFNYTMNFISNETLEKMDISKWNVSNVVNMQGMFAYSKFNGDISNWNVSNVKYMRNMFYESKFNGDISKWDVSNVNDMGSMFMSSEFNQDISEWNVSNVKCIDSMFENSSFFQDISDWNLTNCISYKNVFNGSPLERRTHLKPSKLQYT